MKKFIKYGNAMEALQDIPVLLNRDIYEIHIHHTWKPDYSDWAVKDGYSLVVGMFRYHTKVMRWGDIGQHYTVMPDGSIYSGRSLKSRPASIRGRNKHAIAIECVGNFDIGHDIMRGDQFKSLVDLVRGLCKHFNLKVREESIKYHNEYSRKSCPGSGFMPKGMFILGLSHGYDSMDLSEVSVKESKGVVLSLQKALNALGCDLDEDGIMGEKTYEAFKKVILLSCTAGIKERLQ